MYKVITLYTTNFFQLKWKIKFTQNLPRPWYKLTNLQLINTVLRHLWRRYSTGIHELICHETYMLIVCNSDLAHIYSNNCSLSEFPWQHFHGVDSHTRHGLWLHWILHTTCILDWKMMENQEFPVDFVGTFSSITWVWAKIWHSWPCSVLCVL